jgi:hypothetical protein
VVSAVSGTSAVVPTSSNTASPTAAADKALNLLLQSSDVQQFLASHSSTYLPLNTGLVQSILWAGINVNSSRTINESDLYNFVVSVGGRSSDAHALWVQLAPPDANGKSASTVSAADFAFNTYLTHAISSNLASLQASATKMQQQQGPTASSSVLGTFGVLSGSGSYIGSGIFINVFV